MFKSDRQTTENKGGVWIAYGSNMPTGDLNGLEALTVIVKRLRECDIIVDRISSLWRSRAWPNPNDPPFSNAVMRVTTDLNPENLLKVLHLLEDKSGRRRDEDFQKKINAPRVLDLDLIAYDNLIDDGHFSGVQLPHPRAHERGFVMGPMCEIAPDWVHPVLAKTASELFATVTVAADAYPAEGTEGVLR